MVRERITLTLRDDLVRQVDRLVDGLTIRSRSQAVEYLLTKFLADFRLGSAVILAGGPKKSLTIKGKVKFLEDVGGKPLVERVMGSIAEFNVPEMLVYVDSFGEKIVGELAGKKLGYSVRFIEGERPTGTVEPLRRAKELLKDTFLVAYGDTLAGINLNDMLQFHRKNRALATIALTTVSNPKEFGVAILQGNRITEFVEKPRKSAKSYLVNAGYFLFEPEIFRHIGRDMKSIEKELFPKLAKKGLLYGYPFQGKYVNVNSQADLDRARVLV